MVRHYCSKSKYNGVLTPTTLTFLRISPAARARMTVLVSHLLEFGRGRGLACAAHTRHLIVFQLKVRNAGSPTRLVLGTLLRWCCACGKLHNLDLSIEMYMMTVGRWRIFVAIYLLRNVDFHRRHTCNLLCAK